MALRSLELRALDSLSTCPRMLALVWYWLTVITTFYCGIEHVLPTIYTGELEWLLATEKILGTFFLVETTVNWFCLRFVSSKFRPSDLADHTPPIDRSRGFEIDLDRLRVRSNGGRANHETYSLPLSSIRPIGNDPCCSWNHDTMYLVSLQADEACFVTSNRVVRPDVRRFRGDENENEVEPEEEDEGIMPGSCVSVESQMTSQNGMNKRSKIDFENSVQPSRRDREPSGEYASRMENLFHGSPLKRVEVENGGKIDGRLVVYPYWSWKTCRRCKVLRPPRAHHCRVCGHCILKRDHHCFFAATCVGLNNQRHFVVFLFWSSIAMAFSLFQACCYVLTRCFSSNDDVDTLQCLSNAILPVTVYRMMAGGAEIFEFVLVLVLYSLVWFFLVCCGFLAEQLRLIASDSTSFERENNIRVVRRADASGRIRTFSRGKNDAAMEPVAFKFIPDDRGQFGQPLDCCGKSALANNWLGSVERLQHLNKSFYWVFGKNWLANFLLPLHFLYKTPEDGITWNSVR